MNGLSIFTQTHSPGKSLHNDDRRRLERRDFSYYVPLIDDSTQELVGHLADISQGGFKLDSLQPIAPNRDIRFRMDLTSEMAYKPFIVFVARSKWCKVDPLDPFCFNVGFEIISMAASDGEIFNDLMEKYGQEHQNRRIDLRRTNLW